MKEITKYDEQKWDISTEVIEQDWGIDIKSPFYNEGRGI